jgi:hypothetical protein
LVSERADAGAHAGISLRKRVVGFYGPPPWFQLAGGTDDFSALSWTISIGTVPW